MVITVTKSAAKSVLKTSSLKKWMNSRQRQSTPRYVIGATNKPWDLDWHLSAVQKRILVPLADHATRLNMLKHYASTLQVESDVDLDELRAFAEGFSGSDIRDVCQSAQLSLIGEFFESGQAMDKQAKPRALTMADFRQISKNVNHQ